jgi:hypothetical protein
MKILVQTLGSSAINSVEANGTAIRISTTLSSGARLRLITAFQASGAMRVSIVEALLCHRGVEKLVYY